MFHRTVRVLAVDWSGRRRGERRYLQVASAPPLRLLGGFARDEVAELIVQEAERDPALVVGLDFAFSFPEWFVRELGVDDVHTLWELVEREGERWLADPPPPFWRRARDAALGGREPFRRTELACGGAPKSVFQLVGNGQVGTGTLRGMPLLARLSRAGFAIWPFDEPRLPLVVEIYPRLLREESVRGLAAGSADAFDALSSAATMSRHLSEFVALSHYVENRLEGEIWRPAGSVASAP